MSEAAQVLAELLKPGSWFQMPLAIVRALGPLDAVVFGYLLGLSERFSGAEGEEDEERWFYRTVKDFKRDTGLSRDQQWRAVSRLREMGWLILEIEDKPFSGRRQFRVDYDRVYADLIQGAYLRAGESAATKRAETRPDKRADLRPCHSAEMRADKRANLRRRVEEEDKTDRKEKENTPRAASAGAVRAAPLRGSSRPAHKPPGLLPQRSTRFRPAPKTGFKLSAFDLRAGRKLKQMLERRGILLGRRCKAETFSDCVRRLREFGRVSEEKLRDVISWYASHYHDDFVPQLRRGGDFYSKFDAITNARNKARFAGLAPDDIADLVEEEAQVRMRQRRPEVGLNYDYLEMGRIRDEVRAEWFGSVAVPAE